MDKDLIAKLICGSHQSFALLYDKWVDHLYRFVFSIVKSNAITEDIVQETFVTIWVNRGSLNSEKSFKSYLFTISYHRAIKELRGKINHPVINDYFDYTSTFISSGSTVTQELDFDEFLSALNEAKKKLTLRQCQIFEMSKEEGLSVAEISSQLSITTQTVSNQLSVALKILRITLPQYLSLFLIFINS